MTKIHRFTLVLIAFLLSFNGMSSSIDTIKSNAIINKSIIPLSLIGLGLITNKGKFEKTFQKDLRKLVGENYENRIDDYILIAPVIQMYTADILGVKSKNHWFDQSKYLIISNLISSGITNILKRLTQKTRPNGSNHAFPSGHTTIAFTNASVLYNEFKETSQMLAYSGYVFAAGTGSFRMLNNKHWVSDVLVGAGIGILVTELVYHFEPLKSFNPFKKSNGITFIPTISNENYGMYFSYNF